MRRQRRCQPSLAFFAQEAQGKNFWEWCAVQIGLSIGKAQVAPV